MATTRGEGGCSLVLYTPQVRSLQHMTYLMTCNNMQTSAYLKVEVSRDGRSLDIELTAAMPACVVKFSRQQGCSI